MAGRSNTEDECPVPQKKPKRDCKYQLDWKLSGYHKVRKDLPLLDVMCVTVILA